jgi:HlyD family secretion protein
MSRIALAVGAAMLATALAACSGKPPGYYQGYVEGKYVYAAPALAGALLELPVREGRRVAAGDLLFALDAEPESAALAEAERRAAAAESRYRDLTKGMRVEEIAVRRAALREAEAALELAGSDLSRTRDLYAARIVPKSDLDAAKSVERRARARVEQARSELRVAELAARSDQVQAAHAEVEAAGAAVLRAKWALDQKQVRAASAGIVEAIYHRPGEWVREGNPVLSLLPDGNRVVRFFVPEPELSALQLGARVRVSCDGCPPGFSATISFIATEAEFTPPVIFSRSRRDKLVFLVEAAFEGAEAAAVLHPGLPVEVFHGG